MSVLLILIFTCFAAVGGPSQNAYYFGGGGEPKGKSTTISDNSFFNFTFIESRGWDAKYLFDGSHSDSQKLLQNVGSKGAPFTTSNAVSMLTDIEKLLSDPNRNPSQIMIYFDTHGIFKDDKYLISTDDGELDILPQLKRIKTLAAAKKVRLGVIGGACFSGNLLSLADDNTCVLTISPPDTIGHQPTVDNFSYLMATRKVKNLEELHLQSRISGSFVQAQALISTDPGKKAYDLLKPLRRHLLGEFTKIPSDQNQCAVNNFELAIQNLRAIESSVSSDFLRVHLKFQANLLEQIGKEVSAFEKKHGSSINSLLQLECSQVLIKNREVSACFRSPSEIDKYRYNYLIEQQKLTEQYKDPNNDGKDRARIHSRLFELSYLIEGMDKIKQTEKFDKKQKALQKLPPDAKERLNAFSINVGQIERTLYGYLYNYFKSKESQPNVCQKFTI